MELTKPDEALSAGNKVNLNSKVLWFLLHIQSYDHRPPPPQPLDIRTWFRNLPLETLKPNCSIVKKTSFRNEKKGLHQRSAKKKKLAY
jgi:hypothetical protein